MMPPHIQKEILDLNQVTNKNCLVYGGMLDLINGTSIDKTTLNFIKFCALFYKHIIVPDAFFHCYGPLHSHLSNLCRKEPDEPDLIFLFLKEGIIVPSLRQGESLFRNWNGETGIEKGKGMIVSWEDGKLPLDFVDRYARLICGWPSGMASVLTTQFGELLYKVTVEDTSPYSLVEIEIPEDLPFSYYKDWILARNLSDDFVELVDTNHSSPVFRRFFVEELMRKHLGIQFRSYQELLDCVDPKFPPNRLLEGMAYHLLTLTSTIYEAYHALNFGTIGGLFPRHDYNLIDSGLYKHMLSLESFNPLNQSEPLAWGSLDVSALTAPQIIEIRKLYAFQRYLELLGGIQLPQTGQSFREANPEFVSHLVDTYLPAIIKRYPGLGVIESTMAKAGALATCVTALVTIAGVALKIGEVPIVTLLASIPIESAMIIFAPRVKGIVEYLRDRGLKRQFRKTNYTRWDSGRL